MPPAGLWKSADGWLNYRAEGVLNMVRASAGWCETQKEATKKTQQTDHLAFEQKKWKSLQVSLGSSDAKPVQSQGLKTRWAPYVLRKGIKKHGSWF